MSGGPDSVSGGPDSTAPGIRRNSSRRLDRAVRRRTAHRLLGARVMVQVLAPCALRRGGILIADECVPRVRSRLRRRRVLRSGRRTAGCDHRRSAAWNDGRAVPRRSSRRGRRHGTRIQRCQSDHPKPGRDQGPVARMLPAPRSHRALLRGGARGQPHPPRKHRQRPRSIEVGRRPPLHRDGVSRRVGPRSSDGPAQSSAGRQSVPTARGGPLCPGRRARQGRHPSRHQAGQHLRVTSGASEDPRLWNCKAGRRGSAGTGSHTRRLSARDAPLHVARAGTVPTSRRAHRSICDRSDPVRGDDRQKTLHRHLGLRDPSRPHRAAAGSSFAARSRNGAGSRARHLARPGEGSGPAVANCPRTGCRPVQRMSVPRALGVGPAHESTAKRIGRSAHTEQHAGWSADVWPTADHRRGRRGDPVERRGHRRHHPRRHQLSGFHSETRRSREPGRRRDATGRSGKWCHRASQRVGRSGPAASVRSRQGSSARCDDRRPPRRLHAVGPARWRHRPLHRPRRRPVPPRRRSIRNRKDAALSTNVSTRRTPLPARGM